MKTLLFCLLLGLDVVAQSPSVLLFGKAVPCPDHTTYMLKQGFETPTTGYDNCESWSLNGGTVDPAYTGVVLEGTQSIRFSDAGDALSPLFTNTEVWLYFLFRPITISGASFKNIVALRDSAGSIRWAMRIQSTGAINLGSSGNATTVGTMSAGTTYHVWLHYQSTVGFDVGFSTNGTRPTSGNNFVNLADIFNGAASRVVIGVNAGAATCDYVLDHFRLDDAQIGDNPP